MRAAFYTLGCKVNQNESFAMQAMFAAAGYDIVQPWEKPDVFVVNSCIVTGAAEAKSRRALLRARRENPRAVTVLTGCFPQALRERALACGADVVCGTAQRARVVENVRRFLATGEAVLDIAEAGGAPYEQLPPAPQPGHTRAFVKVQDGCNRRCAYCIIPSARGPARSRPLPGILDELSALAAGGCAEVVLTGINLSSYRAEGAESLALLAARAAELDGIERIRLSSLEPDLLDERQIELFAKNKKLCPHFHLSLQSGSAAVLRRMRRPYTPALYGAAAASLRGAIAGASLTTDIIVGFPAESEAEFEESLAFVGAMQFLKVHVFPFSARQGTPAAEMDGQLTRGEKAARARRMTEHAERVRSAWIRSMEGTRQSALAETRGADGLYTGYTGSYIPVRTAHPAAARGAILHGTLGAWNGEYAQLTAIEKPPDEI